MDELLGRAAGGEARSPSVAVVVPCHRLTLERADEVGLRHLRRYLGEYDTYLVLPEGLEGTIDGLPVKRFDARLFRGHRAHQRLMLSPGLYDAFSGYEFVLVYHLDSLVFEDRLAEWCGLGYDYVGAPWTRRRPDGSPFFTGVGNGGFSLRRVESCLRALALARRPVTRLRLATTFGAGVARRLARRGRRSARAAVGVLRDAYLYEDKFFGLEAPRLDPAFRVPPPEVAVGFAFETEPRFCFARNGDRLPFGCHKWTVYDPEFWEPYLVAASRT